jgi:hypothetical protein
LSFALLTVQKKKQQNIRLLNVIIKKQSQHPNRRNRKKKFGEDNSKFENKHYLRNYFLLKFLIIEKETGKYNFFVEKNGFGRGEEARLEPEICAVCFS